MLRGGPSGRIRDEGGPIPEDDRIWQQPEKGETMSDKSLTLKITGEDRTGSLDGVNLTAFPVDSVYTFSGRLGLDLGQAFVRYGWAEPVVEPAAPVVEPPDDPDAIVTVLPPEPKQLEPPEDKQQPTPKTKTARRRKPVRGRKPRGS